MYLFLFLSWFLAITKAINIHPEEALKMTEALDCFPDHDKNLFNLIFAKLYDLDEVIMLQAKGLDYFGQFLKIGGRSYCDVFVNMLKRIENSLDYDIHKMKNMSPNKTQTLINQHKLVEKGYYDALTYIRLLPTEIKSKCEEFSLPLKESLNDGTQKSVTVSPGRDEKSILACVNKHREYILRLSIANRVNSPI